MTSVNSCYIALILYKLFCCVNESKPLILVLGKPSKPQLILDNPNPFIGDDIRLKCFSQVQRWPSSALSFLNYTFYDFKRGQQSKDTLIVTNLSKSDIGTNIYCQAVDDMGMRSEQSNTTSLDIFCEFYSHVFIVKFLTQISKQS